MGGTPLNCFRNADNRSHIKKLPKNSHQTPSLIDLKIWKQQLGITSRKHLILFNYPKNINHTTFRNIQKDITRTFPQSTFFGNKKINLQLFSIVLKKLAVYFPKTGYTQGMNFFVGFFLLAGLNVQETFTFCVKIFTNYDLMCLGLYEDQFPLNRLYCALTWSVIQQKNPNIKQKLNSFGITDDLWLFQWFTTFFIYSLPFQIIPQLWTFIFQNKQFALVRLASALILQIWGQINKCQYDIDFLNLTANLKKIEYFNKITYIQDILKIAITISNEQIYKLLPKNKLAKQNKYFSYFILSQNDRKVQYITCLAQLSHQRQQFLKNPQGFTFNRNQYAISVIDSIQMNQAQLLIKSYNIQRNRNSITQNMSNQKLWKSDLHKLNTQTSPPIKIQQKLPKIKQQVIPQRFQDNKKAQKLKKTKQKTDS